METLFPDELNVSEPTFQPAPEECWRIIADHVQAKIGLQEYSRWLGTLRAHSFDDRELVLTARSMGQYQRLVENYLPHVEEAKAKLGFEPLAIRIDLDPEPDNQSTQEHGQTMVPSDASSAESNSSSGKASESIAENRAAGNAAPVTTDHVKTGADLLMPKLDRDEQAALPTATEITEFSCTLNPKYTFDNFVRGPSNQFALATCLNVAENPGINYNPLFLYGSTGLGKTHLQHAVGNMFSNANPNSIVVYISSERFMNEMIHCIRHNKMWDFRQKYRKCDLFLMDDIQFISGNKAATQEEFFHTFNSLYEAKKQIIVTSDLFPQEIPDIEERLRNRFQWGLIADIQPPDVEHRIAILFSKADHLGIELDTTVAEYLACNVKRNIRELEGALHRLAAFSALQGRPIDLSMAKETFRSVATAKANDKPDVETIQQVVAHHFQIKLADLKSRKRARLLTIPRQIAMFLARTITHLSYPEIGEHFGGKDHTTVMHAVKKISKEKTGSPEIKAHVEAVIRELEIRN